MILLMVKEEIMVMVREILEKGVRSNQGDHDEKNNLYCTRYDRNKHEVVTYHIP